jgi:hypothetical protein
MLHAGLELSRKKLDICLLSDEGEHLDQLAVAPEVDSLRRLARRIDEVHAEPVSAVVESMTGARIVHDTLEAEGWSVEIADAQKGQGPGAACLQDGQDRLARARDALAAGAGAGDLASRSRDPRGARARPLSPSPGQAQDGAQEPRPLDPDQLRSRLPGHRPVRGRGQMAHELGFSVKAGETYRALWEEGILEQPMVDIALAEAFDERRNGNAVVVRRLVSFLAVTLVAVVVETAGLATAAALAS